MRKKIVIFGNINWNFPRTNSFLNVIKKKYIVKIYELQKSKKAFFIFLKYCLKVIIDKPDIILVTFCDYQSIKKARFLAFLAKAELHYDLLTSRYDTWLTSKPRFRNDNERQNFFHYEKKLLLMCDKVYLDSIAHVKHVAKIFDINEELFKVVHITCDPDLFPYTEPQDKPVKNIVYYGSASKMHDIRTIFEAAKILKDNKNIRFTIFTTFGFVNYYKTSVERFFLDYKEANICLIPWVSSYNGITSREITDRIMLDADVILGAFDKQPKARVILINKEIEAFAMGKPVVTVKKHELLNYCYNRENMLLVEPNNPEELANAILELVNDFELRKKLSKNGYETFKQYHSEECLARDLEKIIG